MRLPKGRELVLVLRGAENGRPITPPAFVSYSGAGLSGGRELTSPDGRASLGHLAPGESRLSANVPGRALLTRTVRLAAEGPPSAEVVLEVDSGFSLRGHVTDPSGRPVPRARVQAWGPDTADRRESSAGEDGSYELHGLRRNQTALGSWYLLTAEAAGYATEINPEIYARLWPFDRTLDFRMGKGGTVRGRVTSRDGSPLANTLVRVQIHARLWRAPCDLPMALTDGDGRYVLEHVPADKVLLSVASASRTVRIADEKDSIENGRSSPERTKRYTLLEGSNPGWRSSTRNGRIYATRQ